MKVLLFGKHGQVGQALQAAFAADETVALGRDRAPFDQPLAAAELVIRHRPDVVINAAAYTAVDRAESETEAARRINGEAVAEIAAVARRTGAWLVHYSTDYVFDGTKASPYLEDDAPRPLNVYGRTKLEGERAILASGCRHLILRVSWVYAPRHANFPQTILKLAGTRSGLSVVADQIGTPTGAGFIARMTRQAVSRLREVAAPEALSGLYHLAPQGHISRFDLARFIVRQARAMGVSLTLDADAIVPIVTADHPLPAARPLNSRLETHKFSRAFGVALPGWEADMRDWLAMAQSGGGVQPGAVQT